MRGSPDDVLDGGSLPALLASRARAASDRRLAIEAGIALVLLALVLIFRPPLMLPAAAFAISLAMFGAWGILDRELLEDSAGPTRRRAALAAGRAAVAAVGAASAVVGGLSCFFAALGRWMS